jgi:cytidine deaminase
MSTREELTQLEHKLKTLLWKSYSPYSKLQVACIVITKDGWEYKGVNIENASYSLTACAEASAISNMVSSDGKKDIAEVHIMTSIERTFVPPCGACRQRIKEFASDDTTFYLWAKNGTVEVFDMVELLPVCFDKKSLP